MNQVDNTTTVAAIAMFKAHKDYLTRVLVSPDVKHLATCSADHTAKIWCLDPDYPPAVAARQRASARASAMEDSSEADAENRSPSDPATANGSPILNGTDQGNQYGGLASNDLRVSSILGHTFPSRLADPFRPHTLSPGPLSPNFIITMPDSHLPIDPTTKTLFLEQTLAVHQRWVWDCAFSADSAYLVTVCSDHYARLWELASGQIIRQYNGHHRGAVCVALNDWSEVR